MPLRRLALSLLLVFAQGIACAAESPRICRLPGDHGLYGFGDRLCRFTVPARYLWARPFTENGVAVVTALDGREGLIDLKGKEILAPVYRNIQFGPEGQVRASSDANNSGHPLDMLFDLQGHPLLPAPMDSLGFFHQGLAAFATWATGQRAQGFVDRHGQVAIAAKYNAVGDFADNGLASVWINRQWGFIDRNARLMIPAKYDSVMPELDNPPARYVNQFNIGFEFGFGDGSLVRAQASDGWQLIDASGRMLGRGGWARMGGFGQAGLATVSTGRRFGEGKTGLIDRRGNVVLQPTYESIGKFSNGYAPVQQGGKWGYIDARGTLVVPLQLPASPDTGFSKHGIAKVLLHPGRDPADLKVRSMGFGYIDTHGTVVIDKDDYDRVDAFQDTMPDPLARAVKDGKTGYLDTHGKLALGWFEAGTSFGDDGLAAVKVNGKYGYVDRQAKFAIAPAYDEALRFDGDTALVRLGGKWGIVDHAGQVVVPFDYDRLSGFGGASITLGVRGGHEVSVDRAGKFAALPPLGPLRGIPVDDF